MLNLQSLIILFVGLAFAGAGFLFFVIGLRWVRGDEVSQRLNNFILEPATQSDKLRLVKPLRRTEMSGSIITRVLQPRLRALGRFFGRFMPAGNIREIEKRLHIAGQPFGLGAREFYGLRLISLLLGLWLAILILRQSFELINLAGAAIAAYVFMFGPYVWLKRAVRKRQDRIRKDLPDALDMMSVCAQAGLGFDQTVQRVADVWDSQFSKELGRFVGEIEMGVARRDGLRRMADRLDVQELTSFVAVIIQSDQLGMSVSEILQAQARQMRIERRFRAQEAARKVPLKMLFPMILLIFPAMLGVVCGPSIRLIDGLFTAIRAGF
jgi:tight adherence protein C